MVPLLLQVPLLEGQGKSENVSHSGFIHFYFKIKHFYFILALRSLIDLRKAQKDLEGSNENYKYQIRPIHALSALSCRDTKASFVGKHGISEAY